MIQLIFHAAVLAGPPPGWEAIGQGTWDSPYRGTVRQTSRAPARLAGVLSDRGGCWRCTVVPGPYVGAAGIHFTGDDRGDGGLVLILAERDDSPGLWLEDASGEVLWSDRFMGWQPYEPVRIEAVCEDSRLYVQALRRRDGALLAQSDWLPISVPTGNRLVLVTHGTTAEFLEWERATTPLHGPDPNSPSKLRLQQHGDTTWTIVGGGNWQWEDHRRQAIVQQIPVERTTAFLSDPQTPGQTWQCRIRLNQGTCGGGMPMLADAELSRGFLAWLGGTYGDGGLMLYRYPLAALWSSPQGTWHWDTDYVLEGTIADGTVSVRLLAADATTVLAESPRFDLQPDERDRRGMVGFQTWRGTGRFTGFSAATRPDAGETAAAEASAREIGVGGGWVAEAGNWQPVPGPDGAVQAIRHADTGVATARCEGVAGGRGRFAIVAVPEPAARRVVLRFQLGPGVPGGFELSLADACELRTVAGEVLWRNPAATLTPGQPVCLEGIVLTDRVQARVTTPDGSVVAVSPDCYVPDSNNDRVGCLGVSCEGPAGFRDWSWTATR